jgi:hypothetical protein
LKERFGEKDESSKRSRRVGFRIGEGVRISVILGEKESVITLEGATGDLGLATLEDVESCQENGIVLHCYRTPR